MVVNYKAIDHHSVPFYTIRQTLAAPIPLYDHSSIKQPMETNDNLEFSIVKFEDPLQLTPAMRNPKRTERYDFLVELVTNKIVLPGHIFIQRLMRDWEQSRLKKEVMDRKSYKRILDDALKFGTVEVVDVDFQTTLKTITEQWVWFPGTTKEHEIFQEEYTKRSDELNCKEKNVVLVTPKKARSKKKRKTHVLNTPTGVNILKLMRNVISNSQVGICLP